MTLKKQGELTKYSYSSDRECEMSLTLIDVSSDDNPADITKTCSVTATPVRDGYALDVTLTEAGDCVTVGIEVEIDYGDSLPGGGTLAQLSESETNPSTDTTAVGPGEGGVFGQGDCNYHTEGDLPHISSSRPKAVSAHGWWTTRGVNWNCPSKADVTVTLQVRVCNPFDCWFSTIGKGKKRVRSGGGSSRRATARASCEVWACKIAYRSIIGVDLVGQRDPSDVKIKQNELYCRPYDW